jgi:dinuclear metal center YbgI/SA1388 family protein
MSPDMYSICGYLAQLLDVSSFDDMVPNGLQVQGTRPIRRIASAVTASLFAIDEACRLEADILLVHHGLFFKQNFSGVRGLLRQRLDRLLRSGIHLLAYHLPLDASREFGNAWPAAPHLTMTALAPFGFHNGQMIGVKGELKTPLTGRAFYRMAQNYWSTEGIYLGNDDTRTIRTCAFVSGQGHRFLQEALDGGIDCFINGTIDETSWHFVRESGIQFMAFGHYVTEKLGCRLLGEHLARQYGISHFFIEEQNPF